MKKKAALSHKKAVVLLLDGSREHGYVNPSELGRRGEMELLTSDGEFRQIALEKIKSVHIVRDFQAGEVETEERKVFLSRPKLDGLWLRLRFRDGEVLEGVLQNDLLNLLNHGIRLTPPDLRGNTQWIFVPHTALAEARVLGVTGVARRDRAPSLAQPRLFKE